MPHTISVQDARDMILEYEGSPSTGLAKSYSLPADAVRELLSQEGVDHFRIYMGKDSNGLIHPILVGADENEADIESLVLNELMRCPTMCPPASNLNS
jgi:hypothetical protein